MSAPALTATELPAATSLRDRLDGLRPIYAAAGEATAAALDRSSAEALEILASAAAEHAALQGRRMDLLAEPDDRRKAHRDAEVEAAAIAEHAQLFADAFGQAAEAARQREAEAARTARYIAAQEVVGRARNAFRRYPAACLEIIGILALFDEAEAAVRQANLALPDGAASLQGPEQLSRQHGGRPERVLESRDVSLWCWRGQASPAPLSDRLQTEVTIRADGSAFIQEPAPDGRAPVERACERRTFRREVYLPRSSGTVGHPLAQEVRLPGFYAGTQPFWDPQLTSHEVAQRLADIPGELEASMREDAETVAAAGDHARTRLIPLAEGEPDSPLTMAA